MQLVILFKTGSLFANGIDLNESPTNKKIDENCEDHIKNNHTNGKDDVDNIFMPSTYISQPILSRSICVNDKATNELQTQTINSAVCENTVNPEYNYSTKFEYDHIEPLFNDLLLSKCLQSNYKIYIQNNDTQNKNKKDTNNEDEIFGIIDIKWKNWLLSIMKNKQFLKSNFIFSLPIVDPQNNLLKKGEIDIEISFYFKTQHDDQNTSELSKWVKCNQFIDVFPNKYSLLNIDIKDIKSIPKEWYNDNGKQQSITMLFDVFCSDNYTEQNEIVLPLKIDDKDQQNNLLVIDKESDFFISESGLNYYMKQAQNKDFFNIKFNHTHEEQDKKQGLIKNIIHSFDLKLGLKPFCRPGTLKLSETEWNIDWNDLTDNTDQNDELSSKIELLFSFKDPLIAPYIKPIPLSTDLSKQSMLRQEHQQTTQKLNEIYDSVTTFKAIISIIQDEIREKYLKICPIYNDMSKKERKDKFVNYLLSSTAGQKFTKIISKVISDVADKEMYQQNDKITPELTMLLRAKLENECKPIFDDIVKSNRNKVNKKDIKSTNVLNPQNQITPLLNSSKTTNIYAKPIRNINTLQIIIEIALLNEDYSNAYKWITQALIICTDKELAATLYMKLSFVISQMKSDAAMSYHCVRYALSIVTSKNILYTRIIMLCEQDKLEDAEPLMNKLLELYPSDTQINILNGLFEYLMEEVEDAQNIWKLEFDNIQKRNKLNNEDKNDTNNNKEEYSLFDDNDTELSLYDLWIFPIKIGLKYDCSKMIECLLQQSKKWFTKNDKNKIDYILLNHHVLIWNRQYEIALQKLGEAILINNNDTRLWLYIGSTYFLLNKYNDAINALQRYIDSCNKQQITPNLMGIFKLIELYLLSYKNNKNNGAYIKKAGLLIDICWNRIINKQVYNDDNLTILMSFEDLNSYLIDALKYKLSIIKGEYFSLINNIPSSLSSFADASSIDPFDDILWNNIDSIYKKQSLNIAMS